MIMKTLYLNWKGPMGLETVDEITLQPGQGWKDFRVCIRAQVAEYHLAGMNVYTSNRACKDWNE